MTTFQIILNNLPSFLSALAMLVAAVASTYTAIAANSHGVKLDALIQGQNGNNNQNVP